MVISCIRFLGGNYVALKACYVHKKWNTIVVPGPKCLKFRQIFFMKLIKLYALAEDKLWFYCKICKSKIIDWGAVWIGLLRENMLLPMVFLDGFNAIVSCWGSTVEVEWKKAFKDFVDNSRTVVDCGIKLALLFCRTRYAGTVLNKAEQ